MVSEPRESNHEKNVEQSIKPQARTNARLPQAHEFARRGQGTEPPSTKRPVAAHPVLRRARPIEHIAPPPARLKLTDVFSGVYRRGRWAHGPSLSVGVLPNRQPATRVGLRTRRGLKGATVRNRLKRQLRAIVQMQRVPLKPGVDLVIVIHPRTIPATTKILEQELRVLCKRAGVTQ